MPLAADTRHLLDEAAFSRVRPGQLIVNTARGGLIDESALVRAIAGGRVGGAGLDVTEREPLPADDPLMAAERIILTGHSALASTTAQMELARRSVDAAIDLLAERRPPSIVNEAVLESPNLRIPALARTRGG
jgi:D-3-phosphoglycerate dehydrogenase